MKKTAAFVLAILASLAFLVNPGFGALPRYEITDLGTLGGGYGYAGAIDNAAALAGDSCIIDSVNADEIQVPNAFWSASELGWLYTPGFSYILTGVLTNLGNSYIDGTSPLVTLEVYDGLPVEDANLLRSAQFHPADRSWAGGHFDPLVLTAGEHYFIGFRNVKDLWASHSYDGVPLPIYYGYDNDGTYPFTENGDVEYAMLKFQGTHIHPLRVPADYPTIQAAIDAAVDGDTVLVGPGEYVISEPITYRGKNITLKSEEGAVNTTIRLEDFCDGSWGQYSVILFVNNEIEAVLDGFTITGGCRAKEGGGIYCEGSSPTIRNNKIIENGAVSGAGIACLGADPLIISNIISNNTALSEGGGIYCRDSQALILDNIITGNSVEGEDGGGIHCTGYSSVIIKGNHIVGNLASEDGGGIFLGWSEALIENNLIAKNRTYEDGGGISSWYSSVYIIGNTIADNSINYNGGGMEIFENIETILLNNIVYANTSTDLVGIEPSEEVFYSDIGDEGFAGTNGNISEDPLFVNPNPDSNTIDTFIENGDFEGAMQYVRECYSLQPDSPCIDTGDPDYIAEPNETDIEGNPRVIGGRIDMGAFEYSPPIPAEVRIAPRTINLASKGKWITCYIWLPEEYNVARIDPNSVLLEDEIEPEWRWFEEEKQVAIAKFGRSAVQGILNIGRVELTITGQLADGTIFEGTDVIRVIDKGGRKSDK